ncbi:hypothetical protein SAMN02800687_0288 [Curtobacterium sp. UNCCL20]|uniref:hypothetical protein n=1 Tax=Curtobacterium sp. UNCCL20 TaxID=1502773 RepID=UPI0008890901|nr:hypothetical protein [Curtobacterium sp. UNCCL20]SDQ09705.1 hypothetical protein SAMN02800687_0288 [Curtobacterium sp. UNCCL20]
MTPLTRQTITELRRAVDTRGPQWAFGIAIAGGLVLSLVVPGGTSGTFDHFVSGVSIGLPFLAGLLAVMAFTADWTTRAALTTFVLTTSRPRVLVARYLAVLCLTVGSLIAIHLIGALVFVMLRPDSASSVFTAETVRQFGAMAATTVASALTAMAVGGLVLRTAPAIVVAVFAPLLLTIGLAFAPTVLEWANPYGFAGWLASPNWNWTVPQEESVGLGPALTSFTIWTAVPVVLGWFRQMRAEPR